MTRLHPDNEREAVEELLPWYATGRLSESERRTVEEYLARHPELATGVALAREERVVAATVNEAIPGPDRKTFDRLLATLPPQHPVLARARPSLLQRLADWVGSLGPSQLGFAAAAAITLVVAQAVTIGTLIGTRPDVYQTAAGPKAGATDAVELLIAFKPEATMAETAAFLKENGLTLIDGPRAGLFRVRASGGGSADAIADRLAASPVVTRVVRGG